MKAAWDSRTAPGAAMPVLLDPDLNFSGWWLSLPLWNKMGYIYIYHYISTYLVGGWPNPSEKWWFVSSSVGMIFHSQYDGKVTIQSCSKAPSSYSHWIDQRNQGFDMFRPSSSGCSMVFSGKNQAHGWLVGWGSNEILMGFMDLNCHFEGFWETQ